MKRVKYAIGMVLLTCLLLTGCGKKTEVESTAAVSKAPPVSSEKPSETVTDPAEPEIEPWNPGIVQRQVLLDDGYMCGVIFLGYVEGAAKDLEEDREYYQSIFEEKGYLDEFPFLAEIPNTNFIRTETGQELYCVIPEDVNATVSVNQWITDSDKGFQGKAGEVLYRSEAGSPILLKCNASELVSDVEIVIVDQKGNQLQWYPSINGMDGSVFVESAEGKICDFTKYEENANVEPLDVMVGWKWDWYFSEEYQRSLAILTYPLVQLEENVTEAYPELTKALKENMEARKTKLCAEHELRAASAEIDYLDRMDYFIDYETSERAFVRRADSNVLSLLIRGFAYEGGTHGLYYCWGENYDAETGEVLSLSDVVLDMDKFAYAVGEELDQFWTEEFMYTVLDMETFFKENRDNIAWTLDYNGVTVYFDPYDIAPYAAGSQVATVSFAEYPELFAEEYMQVPNAYGYQMDLYAPSYYDVDSDGELDEIYVYGSPSVDGEYQIHNVFVDDAFFIETDEEDIYAYSILGAQLIHTEDGKNYLYVENQTHNDYCTNTIYDLSSGTPEKAGAIFEGMHRTADMEEYAALMHVLTNPYDFKMDVRTWVIGTYDGYVRYSIGENGYPEPYNRYYTFEQMPEFTVLKEFEVNLLDENGNVNGSTKVKAGETVSYYRTDASEFVDFILPNGRTGRADLEWDAGFCSIDGTGVEELFEGVIYAG